MQLRPAYPNDTVKGACFVTGDYDTSEGIIDLDIFVDSMPPYGRLCLSPKAVRMLVQVLGYEWPSDDAAALNARLTAELLVLRAENERMLSVLGKITTALKHEVKLGPVKVDA
jgi:hypothetical protein